MSDIISQYTAADNSMALLTLPAVSCMQFKNTLGVKKYKANQIWYEIEAKN